MRWMSIQCENKKNVLQKKAAPTPTTITTKTTYFTVFTTRFLLLQLPSLRSFHSTQASSMNLLSPAAAYPPAKRLQTHLEHRSPVHLGPELPFVLLVAEQHFIFVSHMVRHLVCVGFHQVILPLKKSRSRYPHTRCFFLF